jgi:hypothetical protein
MKISKERKFWGRKNLYSMSEEDYKTRKREFIPIDKIKIAHYPSQEPNDKQIIDGYHREGIELVKKLIQKGLPILPILVKEFDDRDEILRMYRNNKEKYVYVRMDGFKRLMAHVELGYKEIEAFIDQKAIRGEQNKSSWLEYEEITSLP